MTMAAEIKNRHGSHLRMDTGCLKQPFPAVGMCLQQRGCWCRLQSCKVFADLVRLKPWSSDCLCHVLRGAALHA